MMHAMFACLKRQVSEVKVGVEPEAPQVNTVAVYRDELSKKQGPRKGVKKTVRFNSKPIVLGELEDKDTEKDDEKKSREREEGIRVKVRMTKEEAARLLSKCKEGGVLDFKDVARELVAIPVNRVSVDVIPQ